MATGKSGYFDVSNGGFTLRINWSETYDITANTSVVTITSADLMSTAYSGYSYFPHHYIKVNGETVAEFNSTLGTHSYYISAKNTFYGINTASGSPPPWTSSAIAHNDDGSKNITIEVYINLWRTSSGAGNGTNLSGTQTIALTTIPRVSKPTLSASSVEFGKSITIYTNRNSTSFTHHLYYSINNGLETGIAADIGNSYTWTIPSSLMNNIPNATSAVITFRLYTFSGSTNIGNNTISFTATVPSNVKPSVAISVSDAMGYLSTYGGYIKGLSKFEIVLTPTEAYNSDIASYSITANGSTYATSSVTTDVIKTSGNLTISAKVTDKRGRSGSASATVTVLNYSAPVISLIKVNRCNSDGTENAQGDYVKVTYSGSVTSLSDKNGCNYVISYKKATETTYTSVQIDSLNDIYSITNGTYIFAADSGSSYDVRLTINDHFTNTSKSVVASTAFTMMHFNAAGNGMAIGKVSEKEHAIEFGLQTYDREGVPFQNGLPTYVDDPTTTNRPLCYTNVNTPWGIWCHIYTTFESSKTNPVSKTQLAVPVGYDCAPMSRYYLSSSGTWSEWSASFKTYDGKAMLCSDSEGGNLLLISPNGVEWQMDAHDDNLRFYTWGTDGTYRGVMSASSSNGTVGFPHGIYIGGQYVSDFVVAQGTSGIWTYRKWASGVAECWGNYLFTPTLSNSADNMFYTNAIPVTLPFTFSTIASFLVNKMSGGYLSWASGETYPSSTSTAYFYFIQYANSNVVDTRVAMYVLGKWK